MIVDLLIFLLILAVAVVLGIALHPVLFLIVILAAAWLAFRHPWSRTY